MFHILSFFEGYVLNLLLYYCQTDFFRHFFSKRLSFTKCTVHDRDLNEKNCIFRFFCYIWSVLICIYSHITETSQPFNQPRCVCLFFVSVYLFLSYIIYCSLAVLSSLLNRRIIYNITAALAAVRCVCRPFQINLLHVSCIGFLLPDV